MGEMEKFFKFEGIEDQAQGKVQEFEQSDGHVEKFFPFDFKMNLSFCPLILK